MILLRIILAFIPQLNYGLTKEYILGGIAGFLILFIPAFITMLNMGGDIKFVGAIGFYLGFPGVIPFLFLSCGYGLIYAFIRNKIKKDDVITKKTLFPFAPCFLASYITMFIVYILI